MGGTRGPRLSGHLPRIPLDLALARQLYDDGADDREIAVTTGTSLYAVEKWRKQEGLERNGQKKIYAGTSNLDECVREAAKKGLSYGQYMNKYRNKSRRRG